jgi:DNA-binding NarL/FixJ family response regulator
MVAVAIFSADKAMRRSLEKLLGDEQSIALLGAVDDTTALPKLAQKHGIDVILVHASLSRNLLIGGLPATRPPG